MKILRVLVCLCAGLFACQVTAAAQGPEPQGVRPGQPRDAVVRAFPEGAKIAFVDLERIASMSSEGKALTARLQDLQTKKAAEVAERDKQVTALQTKLSQADSVMSDVAREQLRRELERARVDFQRFVQDAQSEVQQLKQELQSAFAARLFPIVGRVAEEKDLWAVFSVDEAGMLWRNPALDLSDEIAKRMDEAPKQNH